MVPGCRPREHGRGADRAAVRTTHTEIGRIAQRSALRVLGASAHTDTPLWSRELAVGPRIVLLGHERHGLTDEEIALCDELVTIPMCGEVSSINAGVAASLVLYEAMRPRIGG